MGLCHKKGGQNDEQNNACSQQPPQHAFILPEAVMTGTFRILDSQFDVFRFDDIRPLTVA